MKFANTTETSVDVKTTGKVYTSGKQLPSMSMERIN